MNLRIQNHRARWPSAIVGCLFFCLGFGSRSVSATPQETITTWSTITHPLSYQGRTLTRDSLGNYYAIIRGGDLIYIWKRTVANGAWTNTGSISDNALSGREGDCASIAVDGYNHIHAVFYNGSGPDLVHKVSVDGGLSFGTAHSIQTAVTWNGAGAGGPFLHIDSTNGLHVAFIDEANSPYYAYSSNAGSTWSVNQVSTLTYASLRPSVITSSTGRVIYGFSAPGFHASYSDNHGGTWIDASPAHSVDWITVNCRLVGNGDSIYVTGQMIDPTPRSIVMNRCKGSSMAWGTWESIQSGTGADASAFIASDATARVVWRLYPDSVFRIQYSYRTSSWQTSTLTSATDYYIFPFAYWQEFHRFNPGTNLVAVLMPRQGANTIYFQFLDGVSYLPAGAALPPLPNRAPVVDSLKSQKLKLAEGDSTALRIYATDPDGDNLTPIWILDGKEVARGAFTYVFSPNFLSAGAHNFSVRLEDGKGASAIGNLDVSVLNVPWPPECLNPGPRLVASDIISWGWTGLRDPDLDSTQIRYTVGLYVDSALTQPLALKDSLVVNSVAASLYGIGGVANQSLWIRVKAFDLKQHNTGWGKVKKYTAFVPTSVTAIQAEGKWIESLKIVFESQGRGLPKVLRIMGKAERFLPQENQDAYASFRIYLSLFDTQGKLLLKRRLDPNLISTGILALELPSGSVKAGPVLCIIRMGQWKRQLLLPSE